MISNQYFKRDIFLISASMINRNCVRLSAIPKDTSLSIIIGGVNSVLTAQFNLIQVNDANILSFTEVGAESGDYVISWSGLTDTKTLLERNINSKLEIQYVTDNTDEIAISQVDYTNWDNAIKYHQEYITIPTSSTASITLTYTPVESTLILFINGIYQTKNKDYTLSGNTISFVGYPVINSTASVIYMY